MINNLRNRLALLLIEVVKIIAGRGFIVVVSAKVGDFDSINLTAKGAEPNAVRYLIRRMEEKL